MNSYQQTLLDLINKITGQNGNVRQTIYLEGGYFDTRFGPKEFSTNTLKACIKVAEELIKKKYNIMRVTLGILINNIGIICGEDACIIGGQKNDVKSEDNVMIPELLKDMLKKSKVTKEDQIIINERTLRNRGIRTIKDIVKDPEKYSLEMETNSNNEILYSITINGSKIPLAIKRGARWVARCPLIMGQHYADLYVKNAKKYGNTTNQLLIDMCEMYDRHKVNNGAKISFILLNKMYGYDVSNLKIMNFCFNDEELSQYEYDLTEGGK